MARVARVAVENAALSFDKIYTYLIPEDMDARPGCRVTAPFGAGNRTRFGIVMGNGRRAGAAAGENACVAGGRKAAARRGDARAGALAA